MYSLKEVLEDWRRHKAVFHQDNLHILVDAPNINQIMWIVEAAGYQSNICLRSHTTIHFPHEKLPWKVRVTSTKSIYYAVLNEYNKAFRPRYTLTFFEQYVLEEDEIKDAEANLKKILEAILLKGFSCVVLRGRGSSNLGEFVRDPTKSIYCEHNAKIVPKCKKTFRQVLANWGEEKKNVVQTMLFLHTPDINSKTLNKIFKNAGFKRKESMTWVRIKKGENTIEMKPFGKKEKHFIKDRSGITPRHYFVIHFKGPARSYDPRDMDVEFQESAIKSILKGFVEQKMPCVLSTGSMRPSPPYCINKPRPVKKKPSAA